MRYFPRLIIAVVVVCLSIPALHAIPAYPSAISIIQPDGSPLTIRIWGDEFKKIRTTTDGIPVRSNSSGYYVYDLPIPEMAGELVARDPESRSDEDRIALSAYVLREPSTLLRAKSVQKAPLQINSSAFPTTGSPRSLVILVNFTDKSFRSTSAVQEFQRLLNESSYSDNGATGSARDYFKASSNGAFSPQFDVVGPYTLSNNMAYYGANDEDDYDVRPADMVVEACSLANKDINFADYDADNDGYVDNVFIYYAGYNEAEGGPENTVWPHRWWVYPGNYSGSRTFDGKMVSDYACTSELQGNTGSRMCGIGTFAHEFGHVIGLPDHYHTEDPDKNTLNYWSIMDMGSYLNEGRTPPAYSSYDRFFLGWLRPEELNTPSQRAVHPLSQSTTALTHPRGQAFLLSATSHNLLGSLPSPAEFFMVEYRKKTGWDAFLPGEGMLIWHIDYDQTAWDDNSPNNYTGTTQTADSHMRIYLQPLSGNSTTPGAAFTSGSFHPISWQGKSLNRSITSISKTSDSIQFTIMVDQALPGAVVRVNEVKNSLKFGLIMPGESVVKELNLKTTAATGNLQLLISGTHPDQFEIQSATIPATETEKTGGTNVIIRYKPSTVGQHRATLVIQSSHLPDKVIELTGESLE